MKINIVLIEPEIPQNTGNIARTCAVIGADLHLIKPLGFDISEKSVKRAGLDYWDKVNIHVYENLEEFKKTVENIKSRVFLYTTKGKKIYSDVKYEDGDYLVFGPESRGIPESYILEHFENAVRVPMGFNIRSLNLSNTVALAAYEALRQNDFGDLEQKSMYFNEKGVM